MTKPSIITKATLRRTIQAAEEAGHTVTALKVYPDCTYLVLDEVEPPVAAKVDEDGPVPWPRVVDSAG